MSDQTPIHDSNILQARERWRIIQRHRRQSMNSAQREACLSQRRSTYHARRSLNQFSPPPISRTSHNVLHHIHDSDAHSDTHLTDISRLPRLNVLPNDFESGPSNSRLTDIRRLPRFNELPNDFEAGPSNLNRTGDADNINSSNAVHATTISHNSRDGERINLIHMRRLARTIRLPSEGRQLEEGLSGSSFLMNQNVNLTSAQIQLSGIQRTNHHATIHVQEESTITDTEVQESSIILQPQHGMRPRAAFNSARDYHENMGFHRFRLPEPTTCHNCHARLFHHETLSMCCLNGKIVLDNITAPPEMVNLFCDQTVEGRHFRQHIRAYNHVFSFTSMGVHVDENVANGRRGIYTFRAQGAIYHKLGGLIPNASDRPRYLQMYIYDTENEIDHRMAENGMLNRGVVEKIQRILNEHNPFVHVFRQLSQVPDIQNCKLLIKEQPLGRPQYSMPTASQVAAVIIGGDEVGQLHERDTIVKTFSGRLMNVPDTAGYYDSLQYPLILPYGTYGWDLHTQSQSGQRVTCRDYYAYMLQIRPNEPSLLLRAGRLLQQYVVDNYVKIETQRLRWIRLNQDVLRDEIYDGLQDSFNAGETNAGSIGQRTILPSSFVGSPRDMYQRYQDAMSLVQKYGKADLFITMTCNPSWVEIINELLPGQASHDRPDLLARIFRAKVEELKADLFVKGVLGRVVAHVHVFEFQKRGLPHVHMLLILDERDKLRDPDDYDRVVRAEIPKKDEEPELYNAVIKHMIHGPCGENNHRSPCMKNGRCKKNYPKKFSPTTMQGPDSYPIYRRRDGNPVPLDNNRNIVVDNSWVVPYNPWLLLKYDCHINVEICSSVKSIKYLYKYIHKGPDRVSLEVRPGPQYNEVQHFVDARWVCAPEAIWKIFRFHMSQIYPSVERLHIHLLNRHRLRYPTHQTLANILSNQRNSRTMLTEFFTLNRIDPSARSYLYREIPEHYRWNNTTQTWSRRRNRRKVIGRIYTVSPSEGERFYLRILLNHVRGPQCYEDLRTFNGILYETFQKAAESRGLLLNDDSILQCLQEACEIRMPSALRRLFVTILVYCEPVGVRGLWEEAYPYMVEDYEITSTTTEASLTNRLLIELNGLLVQHSKRISDYDLPPFTGEQCQPENPKIVEDELSIPIPEEDLQAVQNLNEDQKFAFHSIMSAIDRQESALFFVDGPGGTGKTYLYRVLLACLRKNGHIALATATSGIAATILPGGRTAHSRFKIPIKPDSSSSCSISKQSDLANLIRRAVVVIWDEATMAHRHAFEALDRTFRDIMEIDLPFGGKVMVFGGDFRQVLPVVPKGTRTEMIEASIIKTSFWKHVRVLRLTHNMRSRGDTPFSEFFVLGMGMNPQTLKV